MSVNTIADRARSTTGWGVYTSWNW